MKIGLIWAQDKSGSLGDGNKIPWNVPADFKHFKDITYGYPVVMGKKSFLSIGKALEGRTNIVISSSLNPNIDGITVVKSAQAAINILQTEPKIWIIGGKSIYEQFMPYAEELVVSYIDIFRPASVKAPLIDEKWVCDIERSDKNFRDKSGDARFKVLHFKRK